MNKTKSKYLPEDRLELRRRMVYESQANFWTICVKLKLFKSNSIDPTSMNYFAEALFKLVKRRHTHLWDKDSKRSLRELSTGIPPQPVFSDFHEGSSNG